MPLGIPITEKERLARQMGVSPQELEYMGRWEPRRNAAQKAAKFLKDAALIAGTGALAYQGYKALQDGRNQPSSDPTGGVSGGTAPTPSPSDGGGSPEPVLNLREVRRRYGTKDYIESDVDSAKPSGDQAVRQQLLSKDDGDSIQTPLLRRVKGGPLARRADSGAIKTVPRQESGLAEEPVTGETTVYEKGQLARTGSGGGMLGPWAQRRIEGMQRRGGGDYLRRQVPLGLGGIGLHAGGNVLGGVTSEGGVIGQGIRGAALDVIPGVKAARGGVGRFAGGVGDMVSGTWNAIPFHQQIGNAAASGFHNIPGADATAGAIGHGLGVVGNIAATVPAELGILGGAVAADSFLQDTALLGARTRQLIDPTGQRVPAAISAGWNRDRMAKQALSQWHDQTLVPWSGALHQNYLVPGGRSVAGSMRNAQKAAMNEVVQRFLPDGSRHPDLPPGEDDDFRDPWGNY